MIYKCPNCNSKLSFILNSTFDEGIERIPACGKCKIAFRNEKLGHRIIKKGWEDKIKK